jgi:hypothetical protein
LYPNIGASDKSYQMARWVQYSMQKRQDDGCLSDGQDCILLAFTHKYRLYYIVRMATNEFDYLYWELKFAGVDV